MHHRRTIDQLTEGENLSPKERRSAAIDVTAQKYLGKRLYSLWQAAGELRTAARKPRGQRLAHLRLIREMHPRWPFLK